MHSVPVDNAWFDDVVELEDDETVGQIRVQPVDVRRNAHRVHPVSVSCEKNSILINKNILTLAIFYTKVFINGKK